MINEIHKLSTQLHPALQYVPVQQSGKTVPAQPLLFGVDDTSDVVEDLYEKLLVQFPNAGPVYAATQTWNLMNWQIAYLSVLSVQGVGIMPDLEKAKQRSAFNSVFGYNLDSSTFQIGRSAPLIRVAAEQILHLADIYFRAINRIGKIKKRNAYRLLADLVLTAITKLPSIRSSFKSADLRTVSDAWLKALSLENHSALLPITIAESNIVYALDRSACCMHYLLDAEARCSTCPKQSDDIRINRIKEDIKKGIL